MKKNRTIVYFLLFTNLIVSQVFRVEAKEKTTCHYVLSNFEGQGLFVTVNAVIGLLDLYDKLQPKIGVSVDFGNEGLYFSPERGPNWWSYYFEPITLGYNRKVKVVRLSQGEISDFCWKGGRVISRARAHELLTKYIKVKPEIQKIVQEFVNSYFHGHFVVGVHYRGTDKFIEAAPYVSYMAAALQIDTLLQNVHQSKKIFVATDEQAFLDFMKARYGSQVIYQNIFRSSSSAPLHFIHYDKYKNGLDAVVDCLLLSRSAVLVKTASNLSACSQLFNPAISVVNLSTEH